MKRFLVMCGMLAMLATAAFAADEKPMGCCAKQAGVERAVVKLDNGVRVTMTSKDAKVVAMLQEKSASDKGCCPSCPMHAEGVTRTVEKTVDGVVVTATAADAALVAKLQQHATMEGMAGCGAKAADKAAGCCAKGAAKGMKGCPHSEKPAAPANS